MALRSGEEVENYPILKRSYVVFRKGRFGGVGAPEVHKNVPETMTDFPANQCFGLTMLTEGQA